MSSSEFLTTPLMLFTYRENKIGDKCPIWGTPEETLEIENLQPNTLTH